jgi:FlaA1/EpsC-like NDP-sugar epimerase
MQLDGDAFKLKRMMRQDAHERAFEIQVLGQRDGERESERIYQEELVKLEKRYTKISQDAVIEHRKMVARSNNETRLEKMKQRAKCIEGLKIHAITKLQSDFDKNSAQYKETLKNLIIQVSSAPAGRVA